MRNSKDGGRAPDSRTPRHRAAGRAGAAMLTGAILLAGTAACDQHTKPQAGAAPTAAQSVQPVADASGRPGVPSSPPARRGTPTGTRPLPRSPAARAAPAAPAAPAARAAPAVRPAAAHRAATAARAGPSRPAAASTPPPSGWRPTWSGTSAGSSPRCWSTTRTTSW
ncbi:hypothetical protein GXW82_19095 [Streptacidiphilus sp. 4-A2]|nr:hypothetical protein [Streptacidiphilus sp. 4-A2]